MVHHLMVHSLALGLRLLRSSTSCRCCAAAKRSSWPSAVAPGPAALSLLAKRLKGRSGRADSEILRTKHGERVNKTLFDATFYQLDTF